MELNIIHFNDVYEIDERAQEPVGGVTRFATAVKSFAAINPMLLFSGDVFNPSIMSTITKGKHMLPILQQLKVACATVGNHEFDYGPETLAKYIKNSGFPWVLSNVVEKGTRAPLVNSIPKTTIEWNGVKVGILGLAEMEWLQAVDRMFEYAEYLDYVEVGKKLVGELKADGADIIVAITHMRAPTAQDTAKQVPGIDLILNGHDHFYESLVVNGVPVLTSGVDFKNFSVIKGSKKAGASNWEFGIERVDVTRKFEEDPDMVEVIKKDKDAADAHMAKVIGQAGVALDCTAECVRTRESNMGNLVCDILKAELNTEIAFVNGGSLRSDSTYGPGPFTVKDLIAVLPFPDLAVPIRLTGAKLKEALEASVGKWPAQVGRFSQVSGIKFAFDPTKEPGSRVESVEVNGAPLDLERKYTAAAKVFIARGNDGYECLGGGGCELLADEETGVQISTLMRRHFIKMHVLSKFKAKESVMSHVASRWMKNTFEEKTTVPLFTVSPVVEGRIINLAEEQKKDGGDTKQ